ncbi:MAG: glycoside hydrolase family 65 protein [Parabacteroides sp.]|nr:glycoside hydrolase family 65 protein [Parabacteroides sp.]
MQNKFLPFLFFFFLMSAVPVKSQDEGWTIRAVPGDVYNGVTLANGRIGLVSGSELFRVSDIVLNGVFDKQSERGVSRIVRGPAFTDINMYIDGQPVTGATTSGWEQVLDMKEACLTTSVDFGTSARIRYTLLALRNLPYAGMAVVKITPYKDITLAVENETGFPAELNDTHTAFKRLKDGSLELPVFTSDALTCTGMHRVASCAAFLFDDARPAIQAGYAIGTNRQTMAFETRLKKGQKYRFALVGAVCSSTDFNDPANEAERMAVYAMQGSIGFLLDTHRREWADLWTGDIIIEGNPGDQRDVRLALYNLYSFVRADSRLSIAPMGLSTVTGYNGHVFWDAELWMYPPLLLLNRDLARSMTDYRYDRLDKAVQRARNYGYRGAMFPWESDDTGEEATPTWCLTGPFEHHITADVGIACWNDYRVYGDKEWLAGTGYPVLKEVADFWVSRAERNADGSYSIKNVVGADEFAQNIDDNAFTNGSAKTVLEYATQAASVLGVCPDNRWREVAAGLKFHYMPDGVMKEHATYAGETIKQGDVNLLAYPLEVVTDASRMEKDLRYYEPKIYEDGPAMGNAVLSVLYCRLGDGEKAYELFKKSYIPNKRPPFGVLSESPYSDNPYFATGAGGLLQAVLNGFGALEITENGVVQGTGLLPASWKSLTITGVGKDRKTYTVGKR